MKSYKLSEEERANENEVDHLQTVTGKKRKKIDKIIDQGKKTRSISLRISNYDLEKLKETANKKGIRYQTLISSILHKYLTNQLYEVDEGALMNAAFDQIKALNQEINNLHRRVEDSLQRIEKLEEDNGRYNGLDKRNHDLNV